MVTGSKLILLSQAVAADGTVTGSAASLQSGSKALILLTTVSNYTDGSYALEVEHSPDGVNWASLGTVSGVAANGIAFTRVPETDHAFHIFRAKLTASGVTTGATVECSIMSTPNRL